MPPPILNLKKDPDFPKDFTLKEIEQLKFDGNGCRLLIISPLIIFFTVAFFYGITHDYSSLLSLFFLGIAIFFTLTEVKFKSVKNYEKINIPNDTITANNKKWKDDLFETEKENKRIEKEYETKKREWDNSIN